MSCPTLSLHDALPICAGRRQRAAARPREKGAGCAASLRSRCSSRPPMLEAFVDFGLFMSILGAALLLAMLRDDAAQCAFARVRLLPAVDRKSTRLNSSH